MLVLYLSTISLEWKNIDSDLMQFVSKERRKKINQYFHVLDKKLSLYSALITRIGLSTISGLKHTELYFSYSQNHKPLFLSKPKYDFSISHSNGSIISCISANSPVGADVEKISYPPFDIMDLIFSQPEIQYINNASDVERIFRFYKIWTQNEAYYKMLRIGLTGTATQCNSLNPDLSKLFYTWQEDHYMYCICGKNVSERSLIKLSETEVQNYFIPI